MSKIAPVIYNRGENRPEQFFVKELLWHYYRISSLTDHYVILHYPNMSPILIDPDLPEPERSSPQNIARTKPDVWLVSLSHGIYCDGPIHLEGLSAMPKKNKVQLQDKEVGRWYEQSFETHSRVSSGLILDTMESHSMQKQLELATIIMHGIAEARAKRFNICLPTYRV